MTRGALAGVLALGLVSGCPVLAPVVDDRGPAGPALGEGCELDVTCARLSAIPTTFEPTDLQSPIDRAACPGGRTTRAITLGDSLTLDGADLTCVSLAITVVPDDPTLEIPVTLTLTGASLTGAEVTMTSHDGLAGLWITARAVVASRLRIEGAVHVAFDSASIDSSTIELVGDEPLSPPELLVSDALVGNLRVTGRRSPVRFRDTSVRRSIVDARSIALERGFLQQARVSADLMELLDVQTAGTHFEIDHLIVTGGQTSHSEIARCGSITLAATKLDDSFVAPCDEALDLESSSVGTSGIGGDVVGSGSFVGHSALGGAVVDLVDATLRNVVLCDTQALSATVLDCVACAPRSPAEVCTTGFDRMYACPGLCGATCSRGPSPAEIDAVHCTE